MDTRCRWLLGLSVLMGACALVPVTAAFAQQAPDSARQTPDTAAQEQAMRTAESTKKRVVTTAATLIKAKHPQEAYALLTPHQSEFAGEPDFDYVLGLAALDSGRPNEAIFALERVLAVQPNHLQARAEIARAYIATGELTASKRELEAVQQQNPPPDVNATISRYLGLIEKTQANQTTALRGYVEVALGDDSNVNSATGNTQVAIPLFGGALATLSTSGTRSQDSFANGIVGFTVRHTLNSTWALLGGANFSRHINSNQHAFDTGNLDGSFGASYTKGEDNYTALLQAQSFDINNTLYRNATGATGQWQRSLNDSSQLSAYVQYSYLSYPGQSIRNADRTVLGGAYARSLGGEKAVVYYAGAYAGTEAVRASNVGHLGNVLYGGRAGGEFKISPQLTALGSVSLEARNYGGQDPLFLTKREDTQFDLKLGLSYVPAQRWTVAPGISYTRNNSNIVINAYDRTVLSVSVRRDFN